MAPKALVIDFDQVMSVNGQLENPHMLARVMASRPWRQLEYGLTDEALCYERISKTFDLPVEQLTSDIAHFHDSLQPDENILEALCLAHSSRKLKCYLTANLPQSIWARWKETLTKWNIFEEFFISAEISMRKPESDFYRHVVHRIGFPSSDIAILHDNPEHFARACALGTAGKLYMSRPALLGGILALAEDSVVRARRYLSENAKKLNSTSRDARGEKACKENFALMLILEATNDKTLVELKPPAHGLWNFFQTSTDITTLDLPNDIDTTSVAMSLLVQDRLQGDPNYAMDFSLSNQDRDHLPQIYEDLERPRVDTVVVLHVFSMFYAHGRASDVQHCWEYSCQVLYNRGYIHGSLYYALPEYFLYAFSRILRWRAKLHQPLELPKSVAQKGFKNVDELFHLRCEQQLSVPSSDSLGLALKIIAARVAGIDRDRLRPFAEELIQAQAPDGSWPWCEIYRAWIKKVGIGSPGLTTAFALKALLLVKEDETQKADDSAVREPSIKRLARRLGTYLKCF